MATIESVHIRGFRSLADVRIDGLPQVSVLIGANGSGKSNFIRFFELLTWMLKFRRLAEFVALQGGADDQLFRGRRVTPLIEATVSIRTPQGRNDYQFALAWSQGDRFIFTEESLRFSRSGLGSDASWQQLGSAHNEARIVEAASGEGPPSVNETTANTILHLLRDCAAYQFHDTSGDSRFKQKWDREDCAYLRSDGGNLAPILLRLERQAPRRYEWICRQIGRVLPVFDRFDLREEYGKVILRWRAKGSDKTIGAHLTSDGSLRFFALVTLLNLPPEMLPSVLLLDEPELGLHPAAIELIGHMILGVAEQRQVILATQSPALVDVFDLDQVIVMDLEDGQTKARKLDSAEYQQWLADDYTPGELWNMNLLGGRP